MSSVYPLSLIHIYMADNVLILQILFSRTLAMLLVQLFGLPDQETILCVYAVSYTHLDVYKRQMQRRAWRMENRSVRGRELSIAEKS